MKTKLTWTLDYKKEKEGTVYVELKGRKLISTGVKCDRGHWNKAGIITSDDPYANEKNIKVMAKKKAVDDRITLLLAEGTTPSKRLIESYLNNPKGIRLTDFFEEVLPEKDWAPETAAMNRGHVKNIDSFRPGVYLNEIDHQYLVDLRAYFVAKGRVPNGFNMDLRTLRNLVNLARKKGYVKDYAFENFPIKNFCHPTKI